MGKLIVGVNDLETWCKKNNKEHLLDEFDYGLNAHLTPKDICHGSDMKVWWRCDKGHEWQASVKDHSRNKHNCPYCSGHRILIGVNDLQSWCKKNNKMHLLDEWDYEKNGELTPKDVSYGSRKKVWWRCKHAHSWETKINTRTNGGHGCPYCSKNKCSKNKCLTGYNDLETWCKKNNKEHLLDEFDYELNAPLTPKDISYGSNARVWWRCKHNHSWQTSITHRTHDNTGCSKCNNQTSFAEQTILYYAKQCFSTVINRYSDLGFELDIYIPSIQTAIEYDGLIYHKHKSKIEKNKNRQCKNSGITLIRIREEGLCEYSDCVCIFRKNSKDINNFNTILKKLFDYLNIDNVDIDIFRDYSKILGNYKTLFLENSLSVKRPKIAAEWHPTLNGKLKPENFSYGSNHVVWWRCDKGHEWQASVKDRSRNKHNCPYCSGHKVLIGFNDLQAWCKENDMNYLIEEWNDEKSITNFTKGSSYEAKWKCRSCGHKWQARIRHRTGDKQNCPYCSGHRALVGANDLQTWCEENDMNYLIEEWDDESSITDFTKGSDYKAKWKCKSCGHKWQARIGHRTHDRTGCPKCAKKCRSKKTRKVLCVDTGEVFDSALIASQAKNASASCISYCCKGKQRTAGGYHWEYVDK